jgi:hypothetical protein
VLGVFGVVVIIIIVLRGHKLITAAYTRVYT